MLLQTHSDSLAGMLERLRDEAETEKRLLGEELEDVLEDLSELEKKEECSEEAIQHLTQKNQTLEQELTNTCFELEKWGLKISNWVEIDHITLVKQLTSVWFPFGRKCAEMQALEEAHVMTIKKLEEDHNSCLAKLGDATTDDERCYFKRLFVH